MNSFTKYRTAYTTNDNRKIVGYIIKHKAHDRIKTIALFEDMEDAKILPGRTARGLQSHFKSAIMPYIKNYCDKNNVKAFERVWNSKKDSASTNPKSLGVYDMFEDQDASFERLPEHLKEKPSTKTQKKIQVYFTTRSKTAQVVSQSQSGVDQEAAKQIKSQGRQQRPVLPSKKQPFQNKYKETDDQWLNVRENIVLKQAPPRGKSPIKLYKVGTQDHNIPKSSQHLNEISDFCLNTERFSSNEDKAILTAMARKASDSDDLECDEFWQELGRWSQVPGRSWQALRSRFRELQQTNLDHLDLNLAIIQKLKLTHNFTQRSTGYVQQPNCKTPTKAKTQQPFQSSKQDAPSQYDVDNDSVLHAVIRESNSHPVKSVKVSTNNQQQRESRLEYNQPSTSKEDYYAVNERGLQFPHTQKSQPTKAPIISSPISYKTFRKMETGSALSQQNFSTIHGAEVGETLHKKPANKAIIKQHKGPKSIFSECSGITNIRVNLLRNTKTIDKAAEAPLKTDNSTKKMEFSQSFQNSTLKFAKSSNQVTTMKPRHKVMAQVLIDTSSDSEPEQLQTKKHSSKSKQIESNTEPIKQYDALSKHSQDEKVNKKVKKVPQFQKVSNVSISDDEVTVVAPQFVSDNDNTDSSDDRRREVVPDNSDQECMIYESDTILDSEDETQNNKVKASQSVSKKSKSDLMLICSQDSELLVHMANSQDINAQGSQLSEVDSNIQMSNSPNKSPQDLNANLTEYSKKKNIHKGENSRDYDSDETVFDNQGDDPLSYSAHSASIPFIESRCSSKIGITARGALQIQNQNHAQSNINPILQPMQFSGMPPRSAVPQRNNVQLPADYMQANATYFQQIQVTNGQPNVMFPNNLIYAVPSVSNAQPGAQPPVCMNPPVIYMMPPPQKPQKIYIVSKSHKMKRKLFKRKAKKPQTNTAWIVTNVSSDSEEEHVKNKNKKQSTNSKTSKTKQTTKNKNILKKSKDINQSEHDIDIEDEHHELSIINNSNVRQSVSTDGGEEARSKLDSVLSLKQTSPRVTRQRYQEMIDSKMSEEQQDDNLSQQNINSSNSNSDKNLRQLPKQRNSSQSPYFRNTRSRQKHNANETLSSSDNQGDPPSQTEESGEFVISSNDSAASNDHQQRNHVTNTKQEHSHSSSDSEQQVKKDQFINVRPRRRRKEYSSEQAPKRSPCIDEGAREMERLAKKGRFLFNKK